MQTGSRSGRSPLSNRSEKKTSSILVSQNPMQLRTRLVSFPFSRGDARVKRKARKERQSKRKTEREIEKEKRRKRDGKNKLSGKEGGNGPKRRECKLIAP